MRSAGMPQFYGGACCEVTALQGEGCARRPLTPKLGKLAE
jgi:hypothetical protein